MITSLNHNRKIIMRGGREDQTKNREAGGAGRIGDMQHLPVGGRLFKYRATWRGAAHESVIKNEKWGNFEHGQ